MHNKNTDLTSLSCNWLTEMWEMFRVSVFLSCSSYCVFVLFCFIILVSNYEIIFYQGHCPIIALLSIKRNCSFWKSRPNKIGQLVYELKYFHPLTHSSCLLTRCLWHLKWKYSLYNYTTFQIYMDIYSC